jgi:hypothetical protein
MRAGFGSPRHLVHYARGHQCLPPSCCWCRNSERHFAADLGRLGSLIVWRDAATGTWSAFVLGTERTGFITAAAAQAAALHMARAQLEEGLRRIEELEPAGDAGDVRAQP